MANTLALRKRAQIAKANRTMFLWIAASSVVLGAAVVVAIFLGQKLFYNEKVLAEKNATIGILEANNAAVPELQAQIRVLDTNADLASAKASGEDQAVQVILDALPSTANSLALGASLQAKLLSGIGGVKVDGLQVMQVAGVETLSSEAAEAAPEETDTTATAEDTPAEAPSYQIDFNLNVTGSQEGLKQVLLNLERSLRLLDIRTLAITGNETGDQTMAISARAFYEPAKSIKLTEKVVPR